MHLLPELIGLTLTAVMLGFVVGIMVGSSR